MAEYDSSNYARKTIMQLEESYLLQTVNLVMGKWKLIVLMLLDFAPENSLRYGDLKYILRDYVAPRVLIQQLRELESSGLVTRVVYPTSPVKVEYSLSDVGELIVPVIDEMYHFGCLYREKMWNRTPLAADTEADMQPPPNEKERF